MIRRFGGLFTVLLMLAAIPLALSPERVGAFNAVGGGGGGHTIEDEGTALTQRPTLNFTGDAVSCADDGVTTKTNCVISSGSAAANYYVCEQTGTGCTASDSNACTSTTATCATLQGVLNKLPAVVTTPVTIHVASAAGGYDWTADSALSAKVIVAKHFAYPNVLTIQGYFNSTANQFTHAADVTGTSSGSNTNNFPVNTTLATDESNFNDTTKAWTVNEFTQTAWLRLTGGTGYDSANDNNNWYFIRNNTATQIRITGNWTGAIPDATTTYSIYRSSNMPVINGTSSKYCLYFYGANAVTVKFLKCALPDTAPKRPLVAFNSKNLTVFGSYMTGGTYLVRAAVTSYATGWDAGAEARAFTCDANSTCAFYRNYLLGYTNIGVQIGAWSSGSLSGSAVLSAQTCTSMNPDPCAAVLMAGGFLTSVSSSKIYAHSALNTTVYSTAVQAVFNSSVYFLDRNDILCAATTVNYTGMAISSNSSMETDYTSSLIRSCNIGIRVAWQSTWYTLATPTYSGNTTNESIDTTGTKTTSGF